MVPAGGDDRARTADPFGLLFAITEPFPALVVGEEEV